ncbi:hypothetical protein SDC9_36309 [bioreactor metagenome]|uniref:Uncharacterized protein n=1 Tax=bioreactor metagenome TaxID=1076179 RepID=A0A644VHW1_9ZZZZ
MRRYAVIVVLILCLCAVVMYFREVVKENLRLERNQVALLSDSLSHYRTKTGELVSSVEQLEMTIGELRRHRSELVGQLKSMKIRLRDVQSLTTTILENRVEVFVPIRDTIYLDTGKVVKAQSFHWSDTWTSIQGVIQDDSVKVKYQSRDTLLQVVRVVPKRFLFFRWGVREIRQDVKVSNPNTVVTYSEFVYIRN